MTKLTAKKGICPVCKSEQVTYYDSEVRDEFITCECQCDECDATWNEDYNLVFAGVSRVCSKDGEQLADVLDAEE